MQENLVEIKSKTEMKAYTKKEAINASIEYFKGDFLAADVWVSKYALKDSSDNIYELTPDDMHRRIAREFARAEAQFPNPIGEEEVYELIKDFKYIVPQGSPMAGIGNDFQYVSLSNCFVIGNEKDSDSYGGILKLDQELVQLMKRRAGVGLDLSFVRPKGTIVKNSALTSTGVVPFMERYSNSTREVAQDGRRGALMESISIVHPDAESFIDAKMDETKVTGANVSVRITDGFMKAALSGEKFKQQYPIEGANPKFEKETDATPIWNKIIHNAWKRAEPGILFWDTIIKESIPDCYASFGFKTTSTNPCVVGSTMVAVADGRGDITIKQLADEGKDIPVYAYDKKGNIVIRTMRHPRITGYNEKIYKVTLENGYEVRVTGNHKFKLKSGEYVEVKNLKYGDSMQLMTKWEASLKEIFPDCNSNSQDYVWINGGIKSSNKSEHRLIAEYHNNTIVEKGCVVHHRDYDAKNNRPDNLQIMSKEAHDELHSKNMLGEKNPYHRMTDEWKKKFSESAGELNGRYSNFTEQNLRDGSLELTKKINRRFSVKEWVVFAGEKRLPQYFSGWREKQFNGSVNALSKWAAKELGLEKFNDIDPRLVKTYYKMLDEGYDAEIVENQVIITKQCECCGTEIKHEHRRREISLCSITCHNKLMHSDNNIKKQIKETRAKTESERKDKIAEQQIKIYSDLKFKIGKLPMLKEFVSECKILNISAEIGRQNSPIKSFSELKEKALDYNHKVISIEEDGCENVYNGTVDEFHNFFIGGFESKTKSGKRKYVYVNNLQCGEITLCPNDSCRLLILNLYSYVENPFTSKAKFNFDLFKKHATIAQRLMDDLITLELEKIDKIIQKIQDDPEDAEIKRVELNLWKNIKDRCIQGRRTGLGVTSEGDMIAALGLTYGTDESNDFAVKVHKTLKLTAYASSVNLAKERGAFPIYDSEREKNNPFILRLKKEDPELYENMVKYGRRNIAILTIAPTGSVSLLTQTTSGIEPLFSVFYVRRKKINPNDKNTRVDYVDSVGDSWQEYPVFHHKFLVYLEVNGFNVEDVVLLPKSEIEQIIKKSPYHKATSNDVDWVKKVEMQGRVQKHVDHSISVTVNLPQEISEEMVAKVYEAGWKNGCKGITVYRDGSRSGVMITESEKKEKEKNKMFEDNNAPKRPKFLEADVHRFINKGEKWIAFVGLLEGRPYEIFTGKEEEFTIPKSVESGVIRRLKIEGEGSRYDFIINHKTDDVMVVEGLSKAFNVDYHNYAKVISGILRHGMPLPYVVDLIDSLNLGEDALTTWKAGIIRSIKKYIQDGTKVKAAKCSSCGVEDGLVFEEGCLKCQNCGVSRCG